MTIDQLGRFKREHDLEEDGQAQPRPAGALPTPPPEPEPEPEPEAEREAEPEEAEPEEAEPEEAEPEPEPDEAEPAVARVAEPPDDDELADLESGPGKQVDVADTVAEDEQEAEPASGERTRRRRRGRRGGRGRRSGTSTTTFEATFDHGEQGYGLWLDPAVADSQVYTEHWAGKRAVTVIVSAEAITVRRSGEAGDTGEEE